MPTTVIYHWDFGDGHTSSEETPHHKYARPGIYLVTLTVNTDGVISTAYNTVVVNDPDNIEVTQFTLRLAVEPSQGIEWSEYNGSQLLVPEDVLYILDDNDVPRMLVEEADGIVWEDATFDRVLWQRPSFTDKYHADNIRNDDYRWVASGSGTAEYYLQRFSGTDPNIDEPNAMKIGTLPSPVGTLGSLQPGFYGYGDNDALGYSTVYVRLPDDADPDTKNNGYVEAIYWTEIACEEWFGEEVSDPSAEENIQEFTEFHYYTRPNEPENKGKADYDANGYREGQSFSMDFYKDGLLIRPYASVNDIPENGDIAFSGIKLECRRGLVVFKSLCSEFKLVGRNLFKIIKPQAGSREERTFDRDTAELALSLPTLFIARNTITPLLNRVTGNIIAGSVGSAIGPDGIDGSAIVIPATGLNLANSAIAGSYTFMFWRSTTAPVATVPALPALTQIGDIFNGWQLMYVQSTVLPANIVITQGVVAGIRIYNGNVVQYLTMYYNSMRYDPEPKQFEPTF